MSFFHFSLVLLTVAGMSGGQLLFKLAGQWLASHGGLLAGFIFNPYLGVALAVYGTSTLAWVYLLSRHNLSLLYPFMALAFIATPLLSCWLLDESMRWQTLAGASLIVGGVILSTTGNL